jgi:hypothetical protein
MIRAIMTMGAIGTLVASTGCNKAPEAKASAETTASEQPSISLPADPGERAATCYAARVATFGGEGATVPVEQANEAAQYLLLGASGSGITEPTKVSMLQKVADAAMPGIRQTGMAPATLAACHKAYPPTVKRFAGLPADSRDTRMQCFALSMGLGQIYDRSPQITGARLARYRTLYSALDERMSAELNPGGQGNIAEIAGLATRSMATALELGPVTDVLDACAARYAS